LKVNIYTQMTF